MIESVGSVTQSVETVSKQQRAAHVADDFKQALADAIRQVNDQQLQAEALHTRLAAGEVNNLHDVVIAQEKASLSLQLALQVRNKAVEAYQEMMRMQI